jgi:hypothetical protein
MKYYPHLKIIVVMLLLGLFVSPTNAAILTSSATPSSIFKCGASTISATFDNVGVSAVDAYLISDKAVVPMVVGSGRTLPETQNTTVALAWNGTNWVGNFGNDSTLLWGTRSISYGVTNGGYHVYPSVTDVFVYSDACTGTGIKSYQQMPTGLGRYTKNLFNGKFSFIGTSLDTSFVGWAIYPYVELFGYVFYLLVTFTVVTVIYLKTQNITQPLTVGVFLMLIFAPLTYIDTVYQQWIIFFIALGLAAIYFRIFVRD